MRRPLGVRLNTKTKFLVIVRDVIVRKVIAIIKNIIAIIQNIIAIIKSITVIYEYQNLFLNIKPIP